ncbi:MAG: FKBP-type peptidyl-prolyl cis-trans isomerase [Arenicellales bacterium]|nr:FKBP-type peptidyl-prolyl cis-trans isomerase [Arenicellales bacterium]
MINIRLILTCIVCTPFVVHAQETLTTQKERLSYTIGVSIAERVRQNMDLDVDALTQAIRDVLTGNELKLTPEQMQAAMNEERKKLEEIQLALAAKNKEAGDQFLSMNGQKEGVIQTDSGLQYEIIEEGTGEKPALTDTVVVHYRGTLIDGTEFDSSYRRNTPATFQVNGVIQGWQEGLQLMPAGSKWKLYVPSHLAYGEQGAGGSIGPNETLIFEVELREIK